MAATPALAAELRMRGFRNVVLWSRGVDTSLFHPRSADLCLPMPVFLCVGRVAVEKNLEAFLDLDLPGTKLVVGDGPARAALERKYPDAVFLGARHGEELAEIYAASDIFVFPSKTDTFGLVLLEALASGLPVAAFPVTGPRDVIGSAPVGVLDEDLRAACLEALQISRQDCVEFAAGHTWQASARVFVEHALNVRPVAPEGEAAEFRGGRSAFRRLSITRKSSCPPVGDRDTNCGCQNPSKIHPLARPISRPPPRWSRPLRCGRRCCRFPFSMNASGPRSS